MGEVVSKSLSCFGRGGIVLASLGLSINIDEFIEITIQSTQRIQSNLIISILA
jgi:hypothetical protein